MGVGSGVGSGVGAGVGSGVGTAVGSAVGGGVGSSITTGEGTTYWVGAATYLMLNPPHPQEKRVNKIKSAAPALLIEPDEKLISMLPFLNDIGYFTTNSFALQ